MQIDRKTALVLEGGGMRGVFTSGVLDAFMKHDLTFPYIVAVSAGACNGMSYVSHQPRRARISNIDYLARYKYIGLRHLVTQGCIFDRELLYDKFPNQYLPFDFDTFFSSPMTFEMVTTNCLTGQPMYLSERHDRQRHTLAARHRHGASHQRAGAHPQPRLSRHRQGHEDPAFHLSQISPSACSPQPSSCRLQRTARICGAHGRRGSCHLHSSRAPNGGRPHRERHRQA